MLRRSAIARFGLALSALILPSAPTLAGTQTWTWSNLDGSGFYTPTNGQPTDFTLTGGSLSISYDPSASSPIATIVVSPGSASGLAPAVTAHGTGWSYISNPPYLLGFAPDGSQTRVSFTSGNLNPIGSNGWPESLSGTSIEVGVTGPSVGTTPPAWGYTMSSSSPPSTTPEPPGWLLMAIGLAAVARSTRWGTA